jgi:DNA-binding beta-propeller fold protein YncE
MVLRLLPLLLLLLLLLLWPPTLAAAPPSVPENQPPTYFSGVRDLVYDAERQLVLTASIDGFVAVVDVANAGAPALLGALTPASVGDAHGLAYDAAGRRLFVASVSTASVTCIDLRDPTRPAVLSVLSDPTALWYSTHLAFDATRGVLFVASAGSGDGENTTNTTLRGRGHSLSTVGVAAAAPHDDGDADDGPCAMSLLHRMTSWQPEPAAIPGVNVTLAYPVYATLDTGGGDPARAPLLYVSNDARCTVEVLDVTDVRNVTKVGAFSSCPAIEYVSQTAYDPATRRLFAAAQKAGSFAVLDVADPARPMLKGLLQDADRSANASQPLAGATGCAFDSARGLVFVAAEGARTLSVIDVSSSSGGIGGGDGGGGGGGGLAGGPANAALSALRILGRVTHPALAGEAVAYDAARRVAFVACRKTAALVAVDVADPAAPVVLSVLSSKQSSPFLAVSTKRGVADGKSCVPGDMGPTGALNRTAWWYNWGLTAHEECTNTSVLPQEFVPMVWGAHTMHELPSFVPLPGSAHLLGFNEPNLRSQSNLSAARACELWPTVTAFAAAHGLRMGSPAANHCTPGGSGGQDTNCYANATAWFDAFFALPGCGVETVDFVATHKYGCNATSTLQFVEELSARYGKPVWLTEFSCGQAPAEKQEAFARIILPALDALPASTVERYSWFAAHCDESTPGSTHGALLQRNSTERTQLGDYYNSGRSAP